LTVGHTEAGRRQKMISGVGVANMFGHPGLWPPRGRDSGAREP